MEIYQEFHFIIFDEKKTVKKLTHVLIFTGVSFVGPTRALIFLTLCRFLQAAHASEYIKFFPLFVRGRSKKSFKIENS